MFVRAQGGLRIAVLHRDGETIGMKPILCFERAGHNK
jgi:hypothetical protein